MQFTREQARKATVIAFHAIHNPRSVAVGFWAKSDAALGAGRFDEAYWLAAESVELSQGKNSPHYRDIVALAS